MSYTIEGDSDTITLDDPVSIAEVTLERVATHIFSDDSFVSHHVGRQSEGIIIAGIIRGSTVYTKMTDIKTIMDAKEEVTIAGLHDSNLDGDYRIANLQKNQGIAHHNTIRYTLSLERKQEGA